MSEPIQWEQTLADDLADPQFRAAWESSAVGRALALWLLDYRATHQLSFHELASRLGIDADRMADLEAGEVDPPAATLLWLSRVLETPIRLLVTRGLPSDPPETVIIDASAARDTALAQRS